MESIGKYQIVRVIGEGGMGRVYEAIDPVIGRRVAIKTISLNVATHADARERFFREAQAAGRLSHPNLITIHDIGEADGYPYIVMEYLEGADLSRTIRSERLSLDSKMRIMIDLCEGVAFAHGRDIVHRDIKPGNIFVTTQGRVKILDFGLARAAMSDLTQTGSVLGTPNYMAPEQIRGEDIDHRVDIFAVGVVLYEVLSGRKAFEGDSVATTIYKVLQTEPVPIHLVDAALPAELSGIVERAIAKDRTGRYQTSNELLEALLGVPVPGSGLDRVRSLSTPLTRHHPVRTPTPLPAVAVPAPSSEDPTVRTNTTVAWRWGALAAVLVLGAGIAGVVMRAPTPTPSSTAPSAPSSAPSSATSSAAPSPAATPTPTDSQAERPESPTPQPLQPGAPAAVTTAPQPQPGRGLAATTRPAPSRAGAPEPRPQRTSEVDARPGGRETPQPGPSPASSIPTAPATTTATAPPPVTGPPQVIAPPPTTIGPPPVTSPPVTAPAPSAPGTATAAAAERRPAVAEPPAVVASRDPAPAAEANATAAVQNVLARYQAALGARDLAALKRIWPSLPGRQESAFRTEFQDARAIDVGLDGVTVRISGDEAVATGRRNYRVTTANGRLLQSATRMTVTLSRRDGAWVIDAIRHEALQ